MIKIGITGSLASGKSTVAKIISRKYPLFSADTAVKDLYKEKKFIFKIKKIFNIKNKNIKNEIKKIIQTDSSKLRKLELIVHPLVRKKMKTFTTRNKKNKTLVYEIPLLIESSLMRNFDTIWFVCAKKKIRLKRYIQKRKGLKSIFFILDKRQMSVKKKIKHSNKVIYNNGSLKKLKKDVSFLIKDYE
jgi:dephospho-CoA kinase